MLREIKEDQQTKLCQYLGVQRPIEEFSINNASPDGLQSYCREGMKQYTHFNKERKHHAKIESGLQELAVQSKDSVVIPRAEYEAYLMTKECAITGFTHSEMYPLVMDYTLDGTMIGPIREELHMAIRNCRVTPDFKEKFLNYINTNT